MNYCEVCGDDIDDTETVCDDCGRSFNFDVDADFDDHDWGDDDEEEGEEANENG